MTTEFGSLRVLVVPSWVKAWRYFGPPQRRPSKAQGRKGTKRLWNRRYRDKLAGWKYVTVEPEHMLRTAGQIICTATQLAAMRAALDKG